MSSSYTAVCRMMLNPSTLDWDSSHVMAIVNLTPDSFYAGSRVADREAVRRRVEAVISEGATIVDLGGYSSRPGAAEVSLEQEWERVRLGLEVVGECGGDVVVSIDTFRSEIVRRAVEAFGAVIVNDISAGELDSDMLSTVARLGLKYVAMHMRGVPRTMQQLTHYDRGVVEGVVEYFRERVATMLRVGISRENIILDPGFGFAKSLEQNYELMRHLELITSLGHKVLVGVSRKSMIYKLLDTTPEESLPGSLALAWESLRKGATILRVHDVGATRQIVDLYNHYTR